MLTELKSKVVQLCEKIGIHKPELMNLIEAPQRAGHGHLSLPVFILSKEWKEPPPVVAAKLAQKLQEVASSDFRKIDAVSGFVNFHFTYQVVQNLLLQTLEAQGDKLGYGNLGLGKTLVIDYSSPNVAKPMHVGHLRATVIGQAIVNLAKSQGYKVIGLNHLGDWGVQFGNLAWAFQHWGQEYPFKKKPFQSLYELYVRFHQAAETHPELAKAGAETFKKLEEGDPEVTALWKMVVEISLKEYGRIWNELGVHHDLVRGESFYNDRLKSVEEELEKKGLLVESDGAMVVLLEDQGMVPCLIRKSDGASLYATRDLASAIYRREELKADLNLYVVGVDQTLHFRQVFQVLKKMGYDWVDRCHHIGFGMYRFKDVGKMSSRKGQVVLLEDVLQRAIEMVKDIMTAKNPDLPNKDLIASQVGIGAIIFNDLMNDRVKNVEFDWARVLDFDGDSGPYVQYAHVRCSSLIKKFGQPVEMKMSVDLKSDEETELIRRLLDFPDVVSSAFANFKPHYVATYLLEVCKLFNQFYNRHRILGEEPSLASSRMALVMATQKILEQGLRLLNIQVPEAM